MSPFLHLLAHPRRLHVGKGWFAPCLLQILPFEHNCCINKLSTLSMTHQTKVSVCAMAITYTPLQCNIYTSPMDASFMCHVTMEDTHHLAHFSLQHRRDIFGTSFGAALYTLSTVTHARVSLADQHFVNFCHGTTVVAPLYAAWTIKCFCKPSVIFALPSPDNLLGTSLVAAKFGLCTMSNTYSPQLELLGTPLLAASFYLFGAMPRTCSTPTDLVVASSKKAA
jgi:hypothetical protein